LDCEGGETGLVVGVAAAVGVASVVVVVVVAAAIAGVDDDDGPFCCFLRFIYASWFKKLVSRLLYGKGGWRKGRGRKRVLSASRSQTK
jgi:hypothetical protein